MNDDKSLNLEIISNDKVKISYGGDEFYIDYDIKNFKKELTFDNKTNNNNSYYNLCQQYNAGSYGGSRYYNVPTAGTTHSLYNCGR